MAPVAGDLPCVHYSDSASSDPALAVKCFLLQNPSNEFIIFHGLLGLSQAGDSLIFAFLSMIRDNVQSPLGVFFLPVLYNTLGYSSVWR